MDVRLKSLFSCLNKMIKKMLANLSRPWQAWIILHHKIGLWFYCDIIKSGRFWVSGLYIWQTPLSTNGTVVCNKIW